MEKLKKALKSCRNNREAYAAIKKYGYTIHQDKTHESGYFNIWLDELTRIYKARDGYTLQKWQPVKMQYSGIPTFFNNPSYF